MHRNHVHLNTPAYTYLRWRIQTHRHIHTHNLCLTFCFCVHLSLGLFCYIILLMAWTFSWIFSWRSGLGWNCSFKLGWTLVFLFDCCLAFNFLLGPCSCLQILLGLLFWSSSYCISWGLNLCLIFEDCIQFLSGLLVDFEVLVGLFGLEPSLELLSWHSTFFLHCLQPLLEPLLWYFSFAWTFCCFFNFCLDWCWFRALASTLNSALDEIFQNLMQISSALTMELLPSLLISSQKEKLSHSHQKSVYVAPFFGGQVDMKRNDAKKLMDYAIQSRKR